MLYLSLNKERLMATIQSLLVIDDDKDDFELIVDAVQLIDPSITVWFLDKCADAAQYKNQSFDLVFLDINMPQHDGFIWLKAIRAKGYQHLPVIMYTNSLRPDHIMQAYSAGANLYYPKPTSFNDLINGLKKIISLDWGNPMTVTEAYLHDGEYSIFKVA